MLIGFTLVFGVPALIGTWNNLHCRIVADEHGLIFHQFLATDFVSWHEVEDFELRSVSAISNRKPPKAFVLARGQWRELPRGYHRHDELRSRIEREALWSESREWKLRDFRYEGEWPRTFAYKDISGWKMAAIPLLMASVLIVVGWNNKFVWFFWYVWGVITFVCAVEYLRVKARRRFLHRKIVADEKGLVLLDGAAEQAIAWLEIEAYYLEVLPGSFKPYLAVIESRRGRIEFVFGIEGTTELPGLVKSRATTARTIEWDFQHGADEHVMGGAVSLWKDGKIGVGPKIHHYRRRGVRALCVLSLAMGPGQLLLIIGLSRFELLPELSTGGYVVFVVVALLLGVPKLYGYLAFLNSNLRCEAGGLRHKAVWGERFLHWNDVEKLESSFCYVVKGRKGDAIRFSSFVTDAPGLMAEIESRSGLKWSEND